MLNGKTILVTGGTGSFGNHFVEYALTHYKPKKLIIYSRDEYKQFVMSNKYKEYKEILSFKNVYYFDAILKEIQKDKSYDRIVISEDLEPFSNNNYDAIYKFIFEKLDNISDEAQDIDGNETSIILICTDRHTKGS